MNFKCKRCGCCCKNGIVILYPEDIDRISSYLGLKKIDFVRLYCKKTKLSANGLCDVEIYYLDLPDVCMFLSEDNLCTIEKAKPMQCKFSPESYFNSIGTWKNCVQFCDKNEKPFSSDELSDAFFVDKLIKGYSLN